MGIRYLIAVVGLVALGAGCSRQSDRAAGARGPGFPQETSPFLVKPYLQWGDSPDASGWRSMKLLWHDVDADAGWDVEYRIGSDSTWHKAAAPMMRRVTVPSIAPHRLYRASLTGLEPGSEFSYRLRKGGELVFSATGSAPKPGDKPYRFVVFGDCGANTKE